MIMANSFFLVCHFLSWVEFDLCVLLLIIKCELIHLGGFSLTKWSTKRDSHLWIGHGGASRVTTNRCFDNVKWSIFVFWNRIWHSWSHFLDLTRLKPESVLLPNFPTLQTPINPWPPLKKKVDLVGGWAVSTGWAQPTFSKPSRGFPVLRKPKKEVAIVRTIRTLRRVILESAAESFCQFFSGKKLDVQQRIFKWRIVRWSPIDGDFWKTDDLHGWSFFGFHHGFAVQNREYLSPSASKLNRVLSPSTRSLRQQFLVQDISSVLIWGALPTPC